MNTPPLITTALVQKLITTQFPHYANLSITPVHIQGHDNRSYRLGPHLLIRLPSSAAYRAQVLKEQTWLPVLAPKLPVPIPTPIAMGSPTADYPFSWSITNGLMAQPQPHSALPTCLNLQPIWLIF